MLESKKPSPTLPFNLALNSVVGSQATIIEVSSRDDMIFAYFPTKPNDVNYDSYAGVGLMYEGGTGMNEWEVTPPLYFPTGDGVVAAKWLLGERQVRVIYKVQV